MITTRTLCEPAAPESGTARAVWLELFGLRVGLCPARFATRDYFERAYVCASEGGWQADVWAVEAADRWGLRVGPVEYMWEGRLSDWPVMAETLLVQHLLRDESSPPALHGAALVGGGHGVCILGPPGCGKTTLALALAGIWGLELLADEVAWMTADGTLQAFPRRPTLAPDAESLLVKAGLEGGRGWRLCTPQVKARAEVVLLLGRPQGLQLGEITVSGAEEDVVEAARASGCDARRRGDLWLLRAGSRSRGSLTEAARQCWLRGVYVLGPGGSGDNRWAGPTPRLQRLGAMEGLMLALPCLRNVWAGLSAEQRLLTLAEVLGDAVFYRLRLGPVRETAETVARHLSV